MSRSLRTLLALSALALVLPAAAHGEPYTPAPRVLYQDGHTGRYLLDGAWYFRPDPFGQGLAQGFQRQTSLDGWTPATVPNAWNANDLSVASQRGGVGWYRTDFFAPPAAASVSWTLRFESVNYRAQVYLNGRRIGSHEGAYLPFEVPASRIRKGAVNELVVRVDSRHTSSDLPPLNPNPSASPGGGWWNYGGILREVYLRKVDRVDIADFLAQPQLPCRACAGTVQLRATLHNLDRRVQHVAFRAAVGGRAARFAAVTIPPHATRRLAAAVRISHPRLWEPGHGRLYTVRAAASIGGRTVAGWVAHVGVRSIQVRNGRLLINGVPTTLRGASIHEESVGDGAGGALTPQDRSAMFRQLLDLGSNVTRTHYPFHPATLEMADRAGVLVWDEIPMYRVGERQLERPSVRAKGLNDVRDMILRDQNHPSVLTWSIGNELSSRPLAGQQEYIRAASVLVRRMDGTRLVGLDVAGYPSAPVRPVYSTYLTALGINDYFGWKHGPIGQLLERDATGPYLDQMHQFYPRLALFVTEYGAEANHHGTVDEKGSYEFQTAWMQFQNQVFNARPFVNGAITWILRDFKARPGWTDSPSPQPPWDQKGVADQFGQKKPVFDVLAQIYRRVQRANVARMATADARLRRRQPASR